MCGIAGIVDFRERHPDAVERFHRRLAHRGPDGRGSYVGGPLTLAHTRLAMVARPAVPGDWGDQPLHDGRHLLLYNGEVYNGAELSRRLGLPRRHGTDTEVVHAWLARRGPAGLDALDGMFALFFWDLLEEHGFLARDRLGVKPLVTRLRNEALWFASEARALVDGPRLHLGAFLEWLAMAARASSMGASPAAL